MPPVGIEPTIPARERQQTHALERAATGTGTYFHIQEKISTYFGYLRKHLWGAMVFKVYMEMKCNFVVNKW